MYKVENLDSGSGQPFARAANVCAAAHVYVSSYRKCPAVSPELTPPPQGMLHDCKADL